MKLYNMTQISEIYKTDEYLKEQVEKRLASILWTPSYFVIFKLGELSSCRDRLEHITTLRYLDMLWKPCVFFESEEDAMIFCMSVV